MFQNLHAAQTSLGKQAWTSLQLARPWGDSSGPWSVSISTPSQHAFPPAAALVTTAAKSMGEQCCWWPDPEREHTEGTSSAPTAPHSLSPLPTFLTSSAPVTKASFSRSPVTELRLEPSAVSLHFVTAKVFIPQRQESPGCEVVSSGSRSCLLSSGKVCHFLTWC